MASNNIRVGTCGFNGSKAKYAQRFGCVEVQQTFYQPPGLPTLERWRSQMPADFEFVLKAWQLITHQAKSPTYKRLRAPLSDQDKAEAGFFKPTAIVDQAWALTLACARALKAKTILFQCPASFTQTPAHIDNLVNFFRRIERTDLVLCWEPRGHWDKELIKELCEDLALWHVVDPFADSTVTPEQCYFRLHGRNGWRYEYEQQELTDLLELLTPNKPAYVFFNNIHMTQDALRFQKLLEAASLSGQE
ncbi:DUF72 domain-containing protein [Spirosoma koreense]